MTKADSADPSQLATWIPGDATRPYCTRPWNQTTVVSDGSVVCACVDAAKTNPLGNLTTQSFDEVWNGKAYARLRRNIIKDIDLTKICVGCPNRVEGPEPPADYIDKVDMPRALFIESHAGCNLTCPGCNREAIEGSRNNLEMDFDVYTKVIDSMSPNLGYMEFHLGGENYMHKRANEMVRYCKDENPNCFILTSTNGHFFHTPERVAAVLDSGIDAIIFSIDGADQESYAKYRQNGNFQRVLDGLTAMATMKRERGGVGPLLVWRYILFDWNDSFEMMDEARRLCVESGADHLAWHLNAVGSISASKRYYIGSPHLSEIGHELWDTLPERLGVSLDVDFSRYR